MPRKQLNSLHKAIRRIKLFARRRARLFRFDVTSFFSVHRTVWILNGLLLLFYVSLFVGPSFLRSSVLNYSDVKSDSFDGTVYPITYVKNTYKTLKYEDIPVGEFISLPRYDTNLLSNTDTTNKDALIERYTYITPYMGSYRMNFQEYDGSHPAVDIRAPLGTPVLAIANGVVTQVKDTNTGDGKYIVIRHDDVPVDGGTQTIYSAYEHVNDIVAIEGTKVKRGDPIAHVGMTGITTTPHLHLQIDKASAPYHPYWPYSFKDASNLGLDFFTAINVGLGKENAIANTIHPLEFIQANLKPLAFGDNKEIEVASSTTTPEQDLPPTTNTNVSSGTLNSAPENPTTPSTPVKTTPENTSDTPLSQGLSVLKDISPDYKFYTAVQSLIEK
jgi:murein DD-endopeptidase MepM/ murein hydrolase activator NlpD